MENGLVSTRSDAFPAGLRVLVVDDDPTWLKILEKMLRKCSYEVTKCCLATEALDLLRKRKDGFDIVISDVNMPDMDGFKLLEHVGLEMNLPVIMMSVDGEISRVMKGVLHGACDYLLKPIRMKELQNIWQHVLRKKIHGVKDFEIHDGSEGIEKMRNGIDAYDDSHVLAGGDIASARKRKDSEIQEFDDQDFSDGSTAKKARVVWSVDLHQKFVNAVNQIGLDKVGPKKILDLMKVPWLSRENVASHLQKYRLYLSRLQKQGQPSFGTLKEPEFSSTGSSPSFNLQSSNVLHQNNVVSCSFGYSGNKMLVQDVNRETQEVNSKARLPVLPVAQTKNASTVDVPYVQKVDNGSSMDLNSFGSGTNADFTLFQPSSRQQHPWGGDGPFVQFQLQKEEHKPPQFMAGAKHHNQAGLMQPATSVILGTSKKTADAGPSEMKPLSTPYRSNHVKIAAPAGRPVNSVCVNPEINSANAETFVIESTSLISPSMKKRSFDHCCTSNLGTQQQNPIIERGPTLPFAQADLQLSSTQHHDYSENIRLNKVEFLDYLDPELITGLPSHLHDEMRFNSDFLFDSIEYPTINEGLFIT